MALGRRASPLRLTGLQLSPASPAKPPPARRPEPPPGNTSPGQEGRKEGRGGGTAEASQQAGTFSKRDERDRNFSPPSQAAELTLSRPPGLSEPPLLPGSASPMHSRQDHSPERGGGCGLPLLQLLTHLALSWESSRYVRT